MAKLKHIVFGACLVSFLYGFKAAILNHAPGAFLAPEEDMSFAWFVPLFSLYVIWTERRKILGSLSQGSAAGFLATLPCLLISLMGVRGIQLRFEIIGFASLLVTTVWAFYGGKAAKSVIFPASFLLFCIPLNSFLDVLTVHLRFFATGAAYVLLKGFGCEVAKCGTAIISTANDFSIDVAQPCSGLRSIFALMALTAGYAYFTQKTWAGRAILFSLSVPIAIFGNVVRILTIFLVGKHASEKIALGFYHDYSGYVVFVVALLLMTCFGALLTKIPSFDKCGAADGVEIREEIVTPLRLLRYSFTGVFLSSAMVFQAATPEAVLAQPREISFPEIPGLVYEEGEASHAELSTLPSDTLIKRRLYKKNDKVFFTVSAVTGGRSKSSIHRPELCLPSQGFAMAGAKTVESRDSRQWRVMKIKSMSSGEHYFAYTFFNQESFSTASHTKRIFRDICDRTFLNRIDRWTMLNVSSPTDNEEEFMAILAQLENLR